MKTFVLDTNVLLHDPLSIYKFGKGNLVVIPVTVLEEIDSKKTLMNEVGRNAREFTRQYLKLREGHEDNMTDGVEIAGGGIFRLELNHIESDVIKNKFLHHSNDNRILSVAFNLNQDAKAKGNSALLVTVDGNLLAKADAIGLPVVYYHHESSVSEIDNLHKGYKNVEVPKEIIDSFYEHQKLPMNVVAEYVDGTLYEKDFVVLKGLGGSLQSGFGQVVEEKGVLVVRVVKDLKSRVHGIQPRNIQQQMLFHLLMDDSLDLVIARGPAGTGKTLLSLAAGLHLSKERSQYTNVLAARAIVPMGKDLGALPGEKEDKLRPWMQPIYDNLEFLYEIDNSDRSKNRSLEEWLNEHPLKVEALTYIRGRSIPKQFFIVDEAQNLTPHEVKTILTRAGEGCKIVLLGDPDQIDHPYLDSISNGLTYAIERMKHDKGTGVVSLEKAERSWLAERAAKLL